MKKPKRPIPTYEVFGMPRQSANGNPYLIGEIQSRTTKRAEGAARILAMMKGMKLVSVREVKTPVSAL